MIAFVKQTIISINYRDGKGDIDTWLTSREKSYALKEMPLFVDYCHYLFALPSSIVGPGFEFGDWKEFIVRKGSYSKMKPFSNYRPAFTRVLHAVICLVVS